MMVMPRRSGLSVIDRLHGNKNRKATPIIIVSGDADVKDAIEAMHLHVVDFLLKPIDSGKLLELVKHELGMDV